MRFEFWTSPGKSHLKAHFEEGDTVHGKRQEGPGTPIEYKGDDIHFDYEVVRQVGIDWGRVIITSQRYLSRLGGWHGWLINGLTESFDLCPQPWRKIIQNRVLQFISPMTDIEKVELTSWTQIVEE